MRIGWSLSQYASSIPPVSTGHCKMSSPAQSAGRMNKPPDGAQGQKSIRTQERRAKFEKWFEILPIRHFDPSIPLRAGTLKTGSLTAGVAQSSGLGLLGRGKGQVIRESEYQVAGHQESRVAGRRISGEQGIR